MSEYIYELKKPFEYSHKGEIVEASFVTIFEPNYQQLNHIIPIKQAFMSAIKSASVTSKERTESTADTDEGIDGASVIQILTQWDGNLVAVYKNSTRAFKNGAALVDGQEKFTQPLLDKLSLIDFEGLTGEYIANFIVPSLLNGT